MSPIQNWNVDHISRCHGKRYWVSVALIPGVTVRSHRVSQNIKGRRGWGVGMGVINQRGNRRGDPKLCEDAYTHSS